ncbi:MAG: TetR/AcrR family transcriptional regulator [Bacteroidales bacterium]|jgi:AcrR family transcriptional regulator
MCPRTRQKFEEIRENKRRKILDSAVECFATSGYHEVSINDLAAHAGISKGLMYHYFSSKDELLKTLFNEIVSEMMQLLDPDNRGISNRKDLLQYLERFFRHLNSNLILWKMYMAIFSQPAVQQILKKEILDVSQKPLKMIEFYFKKQGSKKPFVEVAFLSTLFSGVVIEYIGDPENYPLDQIRKKILNIYK